MKRLLKVALALLLTLGVVGEFARVEAQTPLPPNPFALLNTSNSWTAAQKFADGSAGAPSIAFSAGVTTGFYRIGSAILVSSNGTESIGLDYDTAGQVKVRSAGQFAFSSTSAVSAAADVVLTRTGAKTLQFDADGAGGQLTGINFNATTNTFQGSIVIPTNRFYLFSGQGGLSNGGNGVNKLSNNAASSSFTVQTTGAPTCSSNCGTSPSVSGSDSSGKVTMGATGSPASGWVLTFNGTWTAAPSCVVTSALASMVVGKLPIAVVTTTTTMTVTTNGTAPSASDAYFYHCFI